jgi:hypothetical protein
MAGNSNPFKTVNAGDPFDFPAALYNYVVQTVQAYLRTTRDGGGGEADVAFRAVAVPVRNTTGGDLARYSVVGIEGAVNDPATEEDAFKNSVRLIGRVPTTDDVGKFAVYVNSGVADGSTGTAVVSGVVLVKVDEGDGSTFADVADGVSDSLVAVTSGSAKILWRADGTGKQWAVVRIGGGGGEEGPEYAGQVKQGVANDVAGYALLPLVNIFA